jgi:hypothetical protein
LGRRRGMDLLPKDGFDGFVERNGFEGFASGGA